MTIRLKPIAFLSLLLCSAQPLWAEFTIYNNSESRVFCELGSNVGDQKCAFYPADKVIEVDKSINPFIGLGQPWPPINEEKCNYMLTCKIGIEKTNSVPFDDLPFRVITTHELVKE